ncbi:MAG TPA: SgcJ/EcaC family oxidoreductase [Armatimonadota bacterium]|nr:SgcJ/EcaC family oxidoreductase [Armatimonadota bacterium]
MSEVKRGIADSRSAEEARIRALYQEFLDGWNSRSGEAFAAPFDEDAEVIGFEGSQMAGRSAIASETQQIFENHDTGAFVGIIRNVRFLAPGVGILRAVCGVKPAGQASLNPATNSIQTLVATKTNAEWRIAHFQNTPAQFHGRPEMSQALTDELQRLV